MNLKQNDPGLIHITLSERNLRALLEDLVLDKPNPCCRRRVSDDPKLVVIIEAEHDSEHYHSDNRQDDLRGIAGDSREEEVKIEP